jgi:hypothetical protein
VTDGKFYVDPTSGTDSGSGGGDTDGCRFKTLTHALAAAALASGTKTIYLIGDDAGTGEKFPLIVPTNVTIVGYDDTAKAPHSRKVLVPAATRGFTLAAASSGLSNLIIDGANGASTTAALRYTSAIVAGGANSPTGISIDHVNVVNSGNEGIATAGTGTITIGPGVVVTNSGISTDVPATPASGLTIGGTTKVTVTGGAGADQSSFSKNTQHGITVGGRAGLTIAVTPVVGTGDYSGSPVILSANSIAGLVIAQNPIGATTAGTDWTAMPTCSVSGVVSMNAPGGNGIRIEGGSKVKLRNSISFGNSGDGVRIETSGLNAASKADSISIATIDLGGGDGATPTAGANTLQFPYGNVGATYNKGAGICLAITAAPQNGQTLKATGNILVTKADATVDCAAVAGTVIQSGTCRSGAGAPASVGVTPVNANSNAVNFSTCK